MEGSKICRIFLIPADIRLFKNSIGNRDLRPGSRWIYLGRDIRLLHEVRRAAGKLEEEAIGRRLQAIAREWREEYIEFIGGLAPRNATPFWWLTSLSEKNPNNSDFFLHVAYVRLVLESVRSDPCDRIVLCETAGLSEALERNLATLPQVTVERRGSPGKAIFGKIRDAAWGLATKVHFIVTMAVRILLSRFLVVTWGAKTEVGAEDVLIFSWADIRSLASASYTDIYCGTLGYELRKRGMRVKYLVNILPTLPIIRGLSSVLRFREEVLLLEEFLRPWDPLIAWFLVWKNRRDPGEIPPMGEIDVTGIVLEELRRDRLCTAREKAFLFFLAGRDIARRSQLSLFIHPFENHAWEKMFAASLREHSPQVKIIGYLHSIALPMYTCEAVTAEEWLHGPHPDLLLVNGPRAKEVLVQSGYDAGSILVGGSFRSFSLKASPGALEPGRRERSILLPLPSDTNESLELLSLTLDAVEDDPGISVLIKFHPIIKPGPLLRSLPPLPPHFQVRDEPIGDLLAKAGAVLYTSSTVAVEAVSRGVPAIHVGSSLNIDRNMFDGMAWIPSVSQAEDLRIAIQNALEKGDGIGDERGEIIRRLFAPIDGKVVDALVGEGSPGRALGEKPP